jgi:hypothetical protein
VVFLYDPVSNAPEEFWRAKLKDLRSKAQPVNVEVQPVVVSDPSSFPQTFAEFGRGTNGPVLENPNVLSLTADQVCRLAAQRRLPAIGWGSRFASAGCLINLKTAKVLSVTILQALLQRADETILLTARSPTSYRP